MLLPLRALAFACLAFLLAGTAAAQSLPNADAGDDQTIACAPASGVQVSLDGTESFDPDGQPLTYSWTEGATVLSTAAAPTVALLPGVHVITLTVNDGAQGSDSDSVTITVNADVEPPTLVLADLSDELWPPNHKTTAYAVSDLVESVSDDCSELSVDDVVFIGATSDEPDNGPGDGNTTGDVSYSVDCLEAFVRAERTGRGDGRVYQLFLAVTDGAGNTSEEAVFEVDVPHDRAHSAQDSGPEADYECVAIAPCADVPGECALSSKAQVTLRETRRGPTLSWQAKGLPTNGVDPDASRVCMYVDDELAGSASDPDRLRLRRGALKLFTKGGDLEIPELPLPEDALLRLELHDGDACVASEFSDPKVNRSNVYRARAR
jgi:hypothetical protein